MKKIWILLILMVSLAMAVSAKVPVVTTLSTSGVGYDINYPLVPTYMQNNTNEFFFHVYNRSNGIPITANINCYFHLYGVNKTHLVFLENSVASDDFDYAFAVPASNFTELGDYSYLVHCNDSALGGYVAASFEVTETGVEPTPEKSILILALLIGITLTLMGCAFLFAYIYSNTDPVNRFLKILFLGASLLSGIGSLAVQQIVVKSQETIAGPILSTAVNTYYTMGLWIFRIVMIAFIVWLIYTASMNALGHKIDGPESDR